MATTAAALQPPRLPLIVLVGTTGSGKSRLAIDIALASTRAGRPGEIINADVIAMYAGLDVAAAKVPPSSQAGVPHHLTSFLSYPRACITVRDYRALATAAIQDVHARRGLPIVTGGTMYYTQALLRGSGTLQEDEEGATAAGRGEGEEEGHVEANAGSFATPWHRLESVDAPMARRLHPNDSRKIARALAVFDRTGRPYTQVLRTQAERLGKDGDASPWDTLVLWPRVGARPGAALDARLAARTRGMAAAGILEEVHALREHLLGEGAWGRGEGEDTATLLTARLVAAHCEGGGTFPHPATPSSSSSHTGLLQAIGYKEFEPYLALGTRAGAGEVEAALGAALRPVGAKSKKGGGGEALADGFRSLQEGTRQYSRKQDRWIRNRFACKGVRLLAVETGDAGREEEEEVLKSARHSNEAAALPPGAVVELPNGCHPSAAWEDRVAAPVCAAVLGWLETGATGVPEWDAPTTAPSTGARGALDAILTWEQHFCEACDGRVLNGALAWADHVASRGHAKRVARYAGRGGQAEARMKSTPS
jgi:tRNA dimethylallyltransferase